MTELQQYISSYFGTTKENVTKVASFFTTTELKKGDYFVKSGQYCEKLSFINDGFVRVYSDYNYKEVTQWIGNKGQFITDLSSFVFKQRARWNILALTDCQLYTIEKENYNLLNKVVPDWEKLEKQFIASCFLALEDRIFSHLSLSAEERYDQLFKNNPTLFNQVPLHYLASMLGMSAETFSRIRNKKIS
ncbi:Crp/Fnr family transcriptional regulator [Aureibaculum sp. 2210JD6-5]|uniref:Crp/Fnr family transcriptional regulator n=1 Tax=Aureibaculum sp. 2210JD6-5 TaxID=3103957 RepID=UPI002AAEFDFF|nr:Crp/Fnr family transcriptional regulator [Aureibaculum sp. 2210JD6-5]MDY7396122.1 Crp/Fnr family transcriptional regulator [Aureibaculum sp. 2210JD6-5]